VSELEIPFFPIGEFGEADVRFGHKRANARYRILSSFDSLVGLSQQGCRTVDAEHPCRL
jgi:hypothetical protein